MPALTIEQFLGAGSDLERAQYQILGGLQQVRTAFSSNIIYPHLAELIELHKTLQTVLDRFNSLRDSLPKRIESIDLEAQEVVYVPESGAELGAVREMEDLIAWSLPLVREAIEEGRTIFEFVDQHLTLEQVGIMPPYKEEGYLIVPDVEGGELHVLRYALSIVTRADERYRSLKTSVVKTMALSKVTPPRHIKLSLARERPELPNPATYLVESDLEFPYSETVLPIAKRKLMRYLFSERGLA